MWSDLKTDEKQHSDPKVRSLKLFCDVVGRRSFSRGAAENGMSQSSASQTVNHLEEHLGVRLIDRSKRPFVLTPEGEVFYEGCRRLVEQYYALEDNVRTMHQDVEGSVRVASIYSVGLSHIDRFRRAFLARFPHAKVHIEYHHPNRIYDLVAGDQADLGLVSYPQKSRTIEVFPWREEPMVLACAPEHPLARRESVELADLDGVEMVGFNPDLRIRRRIDKALEAAGVAPRVTLEFDNIESIKRAVEINAGVGLLPAPTVERETAAGTLAAIPINGRKLVRPLGIIRRHGRELGGTARRFLELLQEDAGPHGENGRAKAG
jgi:DNA-binding transcriptional LysR family regulator